MKILFKIIKITLLILMAVVALMYLFKVDYLLRAVGTIYFNGHKTAFLDDYKYFPNRTVEPGIAQPWPLSKQYNSVAQTPVLKQTHQELKTVAFLIFRQDSLWYEQYYDTYTKDSKTNSFSMSKSIVSAALGKAIMQGKIKSLDQPVIDFLPELKGNYKDILTVGDLSSMASGLLWDEAYYSPFSITTRAYFDRDLRKVMMDLEIVDRPGERFTYKSGDTELLAMVLEQAVGMSLSQYVSEEFWKPMGAEHEALWQLDHQNTGVEKAYCCFASNARDFARFGKLYKDHGRWGTVQVLDSSFVAKSIKPRFKESPEYGYGWWLVHYKGHDFFYMRGHLGQFVIVSQELDVMIVRLGHLKGLELKTEAHSRDLFVYIDQAMAMLGIDLE